ncbi:aldose epimerase [Plantibacter flavus]|uniref:aldose epimerase family protein n=1 Tax=Plantibacter flavus TaxID=150123 RepID=UPI003F18AA09
MSGQRVSLRSRDARTSALVEAVVSTRAAALLGLRVDGRDLVVSDDTDGAPLTAAGAILAPWPNRVEAGQWSLDGAVQVLEHTEVDTGHALHGLLLRQDAELLSSDEHSVMLRSAITPVPGYPFRVDLDTRYQLEADGLLVTHVVHNRSAGRAPFALGAHPYLRAGTTPILESTLVVQTSAVLELDAAHIPRGASAVAGTTLDLRAGRPVGQTAAHACFVSVRSADGHHRHRLAGYDGAITELWADEAFGWVQIYRAEADGSAAAALAVEPMTAPPNALRTGEGLRWLAPGETWELRWGVRRA